jgi:hypothetical protein
MAYFDKNSVKEITQYFEQLGFPIQYFNPNADDFTFVLNEAYFVSEPIRVLSSFNGDEYQIYYRTRSDYDLRSAIKKDDKNKLFIDVNSRYSDYFYITKQKGKSVFLNTDELLELSEEDYAEVTNEFTNLQDFNSIESPDYSVLYADNPQVSNAKPLMNIEELTDSQFKLSQKLLEEQEKIWIETKKAQNEGVLDTAMWSFEEIDKLYNSKCTIDDKRAYFIYLQNKCGKALKGDWSKVYGSPYPSEALTLLELLKKGSLFFDPNADKGERLQPKVIYRSGNIWKKYSSLTNRKEEIVRRFGEEIYNLHLKEIEDIYQVVWKNRLRVSGGDESVMIKIIPTSTIATEFRVNEIISPTDRDGIIKNFQVYTSFLKGQRVEDIAGVGDGTAQLNYITKSSLTLKEAFVKWCSESGGGINALQYGIQWSTTTDSIEKLLDRYLKPISNPYSDEKNGKDKWARFKDDAMKVGNRLFAQFLRDGLIATDQTKLEIIWNQLYNSYQEPNLEQVPIGFTYKKYLDGKDLFTLKSSTLNALRYYLSRGSVGLAYGVGIGKTFCAIFVMKQGLDLGLCERPLVIVPNAVYHQFGEEITRGLGSEFNFALPNSRLNMFYNGMEINNRLGNKAVNGINLCTYEATENMIFVRNERDNGWIENSINILEMGSDVQNPMIREQWQKQHNGTLFGDLETSTDVNDSDFLTDNDIDEIIDSETTFDTTDDSSDFGGFKKGGGVDDEKVKTPKKIEPIYINSPDTNYDFICIDEAHNFNNLFTQVVASPKEIQTGKVNEKTGSIKVQRDTNPYANIRETGGGKKASARAEKLFWISRYIQNYNRFGNTLLLSATPFTNSPLQVYTMMAILDYNTLWKLELGIIKDFFDLFAKIEYAEDFRTDLTIVKRNKFIGWTNAIALQKLVYRFFDKSTRAEEDKAVVRPQKINLPLKRLLVNGKVYELAKENYVSTTLKMSEQQLTLWEKVRKYASGEVRYEDLCNDTTSNTTTFGKYTAPVPKDKTDKDSTDDEEVDITNPDDLADGTEEGAKIGAGVRRLQCLMWGRQIALNPYLFKCSGFKEEPTGKMYVEASPKLLYVMKCIQSVKEYTEKNKPRIYNAKDKVFVGGMSGQIIYMNYGVSAFPLIRDYLVSELGFNINEIGIIAGSGNYIGKKKYEKKNSVSNAFLGRVINEESGEYELLSDEKRVKVLIGSESIKEGINLQDFSSVLYNCFLDFNPTDRIQLEGRLWRQGNKFGNVRVVTPLMADCIDVFMFQKLEDKTERINQIWTRNGQINDLDTTAFDPAELKYELISDPNSIAFLEVEHKKEMLDRDKEDLVGALSDYISLDSAWNKGDKSIYPPINSSVYRDFRGQMYYNISQIRPDLIDKPLLNQDNFNKWFANLNKWQVDKDSSFSVESSTNIYYTLDNRYYNYDYSNPYRFDPDEYYKNPKQLEMLNSLFNYSALDLINLMVQVVKEQKVAYPRGYSKNWREVYAKKIVMPILDGDMVEYDTKKGRKKGIAELVMNSYGSLVLESFFNNFSKEGMDDVVITKLNNAILSLKLKLINFENSFEESTSPQFIEELKLLFKYVYENEPSLIASETNGGYVLNTSYQPVSLDIGENEDLKINERNITKVKSKSDETKEVKPTKYPDPFTYSNKEVKENLEDIYDYIKFVEIPKTRKYTNQTDYDFKNLSNADKYVGNMLGNEVNEQYIFASSSGRTLQSVIGILSLQGSNALNESNYTYFKVTNEKPQQINFVPNWVDLIELWVSNKYYGLFQDFYRFDIPRSIADFEVVKEKKFKVLGIETKSDLDLLISSQKEKINTIDVEKLNLSDPQVFQEIVEEVKRKQEALNSEEIRAGSSYLARAKTFANCNPEYLGNEMLSIFMNNPNKNTTKCGDVFMDDYEVIEEIIEEPTKSKKVKEQEVVEVQQLSEKEQTQILIDELLELSEFENAKEKKITKALVRDLKELVEFM